MNRLKDIKYVRLAQFGKMSINDSSLQFSNHHTLFFFQALENSNSHTSQMHNSQRLLCGQVSLLYMSMSMHAGMHDDVCFRLRQGWAVRFAMMLSFRFVL